VEDPGEDDYQLGLLGSGLDGTFITPLHAVQLAGVLVDGLRVPPTWVSRVIDATGHPLVVPEPAAPARVLTRELATDLRGMLVDTTRRGTARKAFRRRGGPLLQGVEVAGKTGSLSGHDPDGRYEWFAGVAPADDPAVAVAVVSVQGPLYWVSASQVAAEVFKILFCPKGVCDVEAVQRWGADASEMAALGAPGSGRSGDGG
jgi:cell division protein FtsI/penicillin-binding protein 2